MVKENRRDFIFCLNRMIAWEWRWILTGKFGHFSEKKKHKILVKPICDGGGAWALFFTAFHRQMVLFSAVLAF